MNYLVAKNDHPEFLIKSTLGIAISSIIILLPFCIYNIYMHRPVVILLIATGMTLSAISAWACYHGEYWKNINLFGVFPVITSAILFVIYRLGIAGSYWAFLGQMAFYFILPEKEGQVTNAILIFLTIPVAYISMPFPVTIRFSVILIGTNVYTLCAMREIYAQHRRIVNIATKDSLTGLYNRSVLSQTLRRAIYVYNRSNTPMSLIMFDVDFFKKINDLHGHDAGDDVLRRISEVVKSDFRESDLGFRIGGEEFLILLYNTTAPDSLLVAEKLRNRIAELSIKKINHSSVTISLGISILQDKMTCEEWLKRCDTMMYEAKINGRNQTKMWSEETLLLLLNK